MTLQNRLHELFAEHPDKKPIDLANFLNVSRAAVSEWMSGKGKGMNADNYAGTAKFFNINADWLRTGKKSKYIDVQIQPYKLPDTYTIGSVPLISWELAGRLYDSTPSIQQNEIKGWYPCPAAHSEYAYCLQVKSDSMINTLPGQRSYLEGTMLFIDPQHTVKTGCRVIAKVPGIAEAVFKEYREDSGKRYLKPLNMQYPIIEIDKNTRLCGVVIFSGLAE